MLNIFSALELNRQSFNSILFRPRVLIDVDLADTRTVMMGQETSLPVCQSLASSFPTSHDRSRFSFPLLEWLDLHIPKARDY